MGGPLGRLLIRQFNLFVNAMIPAGHQLRKPTADEMAHYQKALASADRRDASAVLPRSITASRAARCHRSRLATGADNTGVTAGIACPNRTARDTHTPDPSVVSGAPPTLMKHALRDRGYTAWGRSTR
jgi:hypothetical protein